MKELSAYIWKSPAFLVFLVALVAVSGSEVSSTQARAMSSSDADSAQQNS